MNQLGIKLAAALESRNNDINTYVWKGPRKEVNGERVQEEVRLVDATPEQLQSFYTHCKSMLYSTDKNDPGRLVLLEIIKDQREKCNTELYLRFLENAYLPTDRKKLQRFSYLQGIRAYMENNKELFPKDQLKDILITNVTGGVPDDFQSLTINYVVDGCLDQLGMFDKKHITLSFITKLGIWFDKDEKKEFADEAKSTGKTRSDLVKERCGLKPITNIKINPKGKLNFREFRAMINLKNKKYAEMTTDQLLTLRNKVLFHLEDEVDFHASQWKKRMSQIEAVAQEKGISLG